MIIEEKYDLYDNDESVYIPLTKICNEYADITINTLKRLGFEETENYFDDINLFYESITNQHYDVFTESGKNDPEKTYKNNLTATQVFFKSLVMSDMIIIMCAQCAQDIAITIKYNGINDKSKEKIAHIFSEYMIKINKKIDYNKIAKQLGGAVYASDKLRKATQLLLAVCMINMIEDAFLTTIFHSAGHAICVIVLAPINEEIGKQISIKGGFMTEYFFVFNTYEFTSYVFGGTSVIMRIPAIILHAVTTAVQWCHSHPDLIGVDPKDRKKVEEKSSLIGTIIGILIHGSFNAIAIATGNG